MAEQISKFSVQLFHSILKLEKSRGFDDDTVIGGIDKYIESWKSDILKLFGDTSEIRKILGESYSALQTQNRQYWVDSWLNLIEPLSNVPVGPRTRKRKSDSPIKNHSVDSSVTILKGVDSKTETKLKRIGVRTIRDMLYLFPRRHSDYSQVSKIADVRPGQEITINATIWEANQIRLGKNGRLKATQAVVGDETGNMKVIWFGQPYLAKQLRPGIKLALSGKMDVFNKAKVLESPDYEIVTPGIPLIHTNRLVPIYPLTEGLTARNLRRIIWNALGGWNSLIEDFMPSDILYRVGLPKLQTAIMDAHFPQDEKSWEIARKRLAFNELFLLMTIIQMRRQTWQKDAYGVSLQKNPEGIQSFIDTLPFSLTTSQEQCITEIIADMEIGTPSMSRLLQGEVGSGKTLVALVALLTTVLSGYQGSIMVPTEVLARQHFATISNLMSGLSNPQIEENLVSACLDTQTKPISVGLVTGSTPKAIKRKIIDKSSTGELDIILGTHSLIQEEVKIPNLALAVVDEQHRFGVTQRSLLRGKGTTTPHLLVMSATPIPRTLALTLYGDLDISTISQLPPGRQKILTRWVPTHKRDAANDFVRGQIRLGRQAFIICPLIEESETIEAKAAIVEYERLSEKVFPDLRLGLLHGKMASKEKETVMTQFHQGELDILVSTPVVEVGIDVPNASIMMIEAAHRFGLSQLHQFRGRVGRGQHKSYCFLLAEDPSSMARERLSAIEQIHDGFRLAEVDLSLRGPGDLFGTRQSGLPNLRMARLSDQDILAKVKHESSIMLSQDPTLSMDKHKLIAKEVSRFQGYAIGEAS
ncbi:ATP-dependent DNA helicase RecG [SAR202 cluster bacterium AC-409-J13_OGT_754m]|nr:ATP-dependent DNA helicase RecG [SAR202 cluster bacterium AC-409-J13_OGT_754m]